MKTLTITRTITRTIFLAGMAISAGSVAGPDIVKCIDAEGKVTFTDAQCPGSTQTVAVVLGNTASAAETIDVVHAVDNPAENQADVQSPEPVIAQASVERDYSIRLPMRRPLPIVRNQSTGSALSRDVATLKAARANLQLLDTAHQAMRAQRVAGLN